MNIDYLYFIIIIIIIHIFLVYASLYEYIFFVFIIFIILHKSKPKYIMTLGKILNYHYLFDSLENHIFYSGNNRRH